MGEVAHWRTLQSLISQTVLPSKIVVVNDNSTDKTAEIVLEFARENPFITLVNNTSEAIHLPGSKVIRAFQKGFETLDENYDIIVKLDADLIFVKNIDNVVQDRLKDNTNFYKMVLAGVLLKTKEDAVTEGCDCYLRRFS